MATHIDLALAGVTIGEELALIHLAKDAGGHGSNKRGDAAGTAPAAHAPTGVSRKNLVPETSADRTARHDKAGIDPSYRDMLSQIEKNQTSVPTSGPQSARGVAIRARVADERARLVAEASPARNETERKAAMRFALGKLTTDYDDAKLEERTGEMVRLTQRIANTIGAEYRREGGDVHAAVSSVIGTPGTEAIIINVTAKAEREHGNNSRALAGRQSSAEWVANQAAASGDAKKVATMMLIAHTYRALAEQHAGTAPAAPETRPPGSPMPDGPTPASVVNARIRKAWAKVNAAPSEAVQVDRALRSRRAGAMRTGYTDTRGNVAR